MAAEGYVAPGWAVLPTLVRRLEVPLVLVRPSEETAGRPISFGEIVVPLDGSPLAEGVLEPVTAFARLWDAEISLIQVVRPVILTSDPPLPFPVGYADLETRLRREAAEDYVRDVAERLREQGLKASGIAVLGGEVAESLLRLATPEKVALLAVATHGRGGVRRLVLGSVADKLVRAAEVPVLVVRPRKSTGRSRKARQSLALPAGMLI